MSSAEELHQTIDAQLAIIAGSVARSTQLQAHRNTVVAPIDKELADEEAIQTAAMNTIQVMLEDAGVRTAAFAGSGKTLRLPNGEVSLHSSTSLIIENAKLAIAWLRKHHMLRRFTRVKEPELDKPKLTKAPSIVAKMPGVSLVTQENLTIVVPGFSKPVSRLLGGLKRKLPSP